MFKKYYKQANDDIETNRDLIDIIFEEAAKPQRLKVSSKIYKFGMSVAAVLVIAVSAVMFIHFDDGAETSKPDKGTIAMVENSDSGRTKSQDTVANDSSKKDVDSISYDEKQENEKAVAPDKASSGVASEETDERPSSGMKKENPVVDNRNGVTGDKADETSENPSHISEKRQDETRSGGAMVNPIEPIDAQTKNENPSSDNAPVLAVEISEENNNTGGSPKARGVESQEMPAEPLTEQCEASLEELTEVTEGEGNVVQNMLYSYFGETDEETGNQYLFEIVGRNDSVYVGRWRWLVDGHSSLLTEFVVTSNMSEMYESSVVDDKVQWSTENNLLLD